MNITLNVKESNLTLIGVFCGEVISHIEPIESNLKYTASFLRFFGDGTVISVSVAFTDLDIMSLWQNSMSKWFNWDYRHQNSGEYTLKDKIIEFWITASEGQEVYYSGNYSEDELTLDVSPYHEVWNYCRAYKRLTSS